MSQKIEIFPVRGDSTIQTEHRSIGTGKFILGIYTKFKIESGLDYIKHVYGISNSELLLEKNIPTKIKKTKTNPPKKTKNPTKKPPKLTIGTENPNC